MKSFEIAKQTFHKSSLNYRCSTTKCYCAWFFSDGKYFQDDSGLITERSWIDLYEALTPINELTVETVKVFINDHKEAYELHQETLLNDWYTPHFGDDFEAQKEFEMQEVKRLKRIEEIVEGNKKKYQQMMEVNHG